MAADVKEQGAGNAMPTFLNVENPYRRSARLYPALVTVALLLPAAIMLGLPLKGWMAAMSAGGGLVVATAAVALLMQMASMAGDTIQKKLYPRWPHDSPTNRLLNPVDDTCSQQQKQKWYEATHRLTGIDIAAVAGNPAEVERAINDAVRTLRTEVFYGNKLAERLDMHNTDYGQVRNFAGLRPIWLLTSFTSGVICWVVYAMGPQSIALPLISTALFIACVFAAFVIDGYVRQAAQHYADSFFGALDACDRALQAEAEGKSVGGIAEPPSQAPAS